VNEAIESCYDYFRRLDYEFKPYYQPKLDEVDVKAKAVRTEAGYKEFVEALKQFHETVNFLERLDK
jgi:L-arabinose isomerase